MNKFQSFLLAGSFFFTNFSFAQTFPVGNLVVNGTASIAGVTSVSGGLNSSGNSVFSAPVTVSAPSTFSGIANFTVPPTAPTAALGTNNTQVATTAFVQNTGIRYPVSGGRSFSSSAPLSAAAFGGWGIVTGQNVTITLPAISSVLAGSSFNFIPWSNPFTVTATGSATIFSSGTPATSQVFGPNESVTLTSDGNNWYATSGGMTSKVPGCLSILGFGGDNTGTFDNTTAFSAALAASPAGRACVFFPPGVYTFNSGQTINYTGNYQSVRLVGAGQEVTILNWGGGQGLSLNFLTDANTFHISDMTLTTATVGQGPAISVANTNGDSFATNQSASDITNVTIRGADGIGATDYWTYGVYLNGVSNVNLTNLFVIGETTHSHANGVFFGGTATTIPVVLNIQGSQFNELAAGVIYGNYAQGVTINQSNFTNDNIGVSVPAGETGLDQLNISGSQFNCFSEAIGLNSGVIQTGIVGNLFLIEGTSNGIYANNYYSTTITGNNFAPAASGLSNTIGISFVTNKALNSIVTGNTFSQLTTAVNLQAGSANVSVQSNAYSGNTNNVVNNCSSGCSVGVATP